MKDLVTMEPNNNPLTCQAVLDELPLYWYGELASAAEAAIEHHLQGCPGCSHEFEVWKQTFASLDSATLEPSKSLLDECRAELHQSIALAAPPPAGNTFTHWLRQLSAGFVLRPLPAAAGAFAMAAFGFYGAHWLGPVGPAEANADQIRASRVRYVTPDANGMIRLVVEETRERELIGRPDDLAIRGLLVRAAQNSTDPSVRVETVEMLNRESETSEVRDALLSVLEHDTNPGVRLKAIEGLRAYANEDAVRRGLSTVLLRDQDTGVRIQAIDTLMRMRAPEIGVLQELIRREDNDYIRQRTLRALADMNASPGTF